MSRPDSKRRWIRRILYQFRRTHGVPAEFYQNSSSPNFETGETGSTRTKIDIPQFITGDVSLIRKFEYDIGFVKGNSNFTYGMLFEVGDRVGIIDGMYLGEYEPKQEDYLVFEDKRYNFVKIIALDGKVGYVVHVRHTKKQPAKRIVEKVIFSNLFDLEQEVAYEI
jgi:hypothetical protein